MSQFDMDNVPAAPPPFPQQLAQFPLAAKWPMAIGLVSLILGIGYLGGAMGQAISLGFTLPQIHGNMSIIFLNGLPTVINGVLLLIAAILLLRRKPLARAMHYAYAVVALSLGLLSLATAAIQISTVFPPSELPAAYIVPGLSRLIEAYPIFCLIWFSRADVRLDIHEMAEPPMET